MADMTMAEVTRRRIERRLAILRDMAVAKYAEAVSQGEESRARQEAIALDFAVEALEQLQATRDRHAALEVHAAELHTVLRDLIQWIEHFPGEGDPDVLMDRAHAALRTPPPAAGQAILAEVTRLRKVRDALRKVGDRPYDTEAAADLESALEELDTLDQSAPQEPTDG